MWHHGLYLDVKVSNVSLVKVVEPLQHLTNTGPDLHSTIVFSIHPTSWQFQHLKRDGVTVYCINKYCIVTNLGLHESGFLGQSLQKLLMISLQNH